MDDHKDLQNRVFDLIQDGLSFVYRSNATAKSRSEILTSEILHILHLCGESYDRPHWRVPVGKLLDLAIEDEETAMFNWSNETWHTSMAIIALAPTLTPKDHKTRLYRTVKGAVRWLLNERGGWKDTWDGELWETSLALLALMKSKKSGLVSANQLRWISNTIGWLIDVGFSTKNHLGYHYIGLILWTLHETTEQLRMKPQLLEVVRQAEERFSNFVLDQLHSSPELVMPDEACWMTGLILYGLIHSGHWPDNLDMINEVLTYIERENKKLDREGWYDLESTYYILLALTELYHCLSIRILSINNTKSQSTKAYTASVRELHMRLEGLRETAEKPVQLLSPGCPIGHETCEYRETTSLDERYNDRNIFLAIPFSGFNKQETIIREVLELADLIPIISNPEAEQENTSTDILCQICQRISECRYGLVDLTGVERRPNIAYELGLLHAFNRQTGLLVESKEDGRDSIEQYFSDIKQLQYHKYSGGKDRDISLATKVKDWICSINASSIDKKIFEQDFAKRYSKPN